jgi:hypothetical protein
MLAESEDGLIALVKKSALAGRLAKVGALPEVDGEALVKRFGTDAPAVYVSPGQIEIKDDTLRLHYGIGCVARNAAGQAAARKGDGNTIGLYQIIEGVVALAHGARVADYNWVVVDAKPIHDELLAKNNLHVAVVTVRTAGWIDMPPALDEAALADFIRFRADYDLEPFETAEEHSKWVGDPPDHGTSVPEVSETVTVQTP